MLNRRHLRTIAVQALFQFDAQGPGFDERLQEFLTDRRLGGAELEFVRRRIDAWVEHRAEIDDLLSQAAEHWELGRMPPVDRSILRLAVCELRFCADTPPKAVINEAIELAKSFGAAESAQFVNGLLDAIWKKLNNPPSARAGDDP